ncbi:MAG: diguanylate cyclase [Betaproteobacteria bacterium]|nr:diguanylate cyclase [Betaproteobacteria bacterium]
MPIDPVPQSSAPPKVTPSRDRHPHARCWGVLAAWAAALACVSPTASGMHDGNGAAVMAGTPPIERFSPTIDIYPQHFCVQQDSTGRVLICSTDGLVEFDSERWRLNRMPNGEIVRSLAVGRQDTVYVGGYNQFGVMRRNAAGRLQFEDLTPKFAAMLKDREFADIWEVVETPDGVYFRALYDLFRWNPDSGQVAHWHHPGRLGWIAHKAGRTTVQFRGEGVKALDGNAWKLLAGGAQFKVLMQAWLPLDDGRTLVVDAEGQWWMVDKGGQAQAMKRPSGVPESASITCAAVLPDGGVVLGTASGEVLFTDAHFAAAHRVSLESGFVTGVAWQRNGGLLAAVQGSIYRVGWPATWTVLGQEHGISGNFSSLVEWNGSLHVLASGGIYRAARGEPTIRFRRMPGRADTPNHLAPLDARRALLAESRHVALIEGDRIRELSPETMYPREFTRSRFHKNLVFMHTEHGLRTIDLGNGMKISRPLPDKDGVLISTLVEVSATEVWAGTGRHGILRYTLGSKGELLEAVPLTPAEGVEYGQVSECYLSETGPRDANGKPQWVASTKKGVFRWNGSRFEREPLDNLATMLRDDEALVFVARPDGALWAYGNTRIFAREAGRTAWRQQEIRPLLRGALVHHATLSDGQLAFVTSNGVLIHHPPPAAPRTPETNGSTQSPYTLGMTSVTLLRNGKTVELPLAPETPPQIDEGEFALRFDFALPELTREGIKRYQGHMTGEEAKMSDWGLPSRYTYYNMRPGEFALRIRAMDSDGRISEMAPYRFVVVPPWYARPWAKVIYLLGAMLLAGILVLAYIRARTERFRRANAALEEGIAARTRELAEANRRLDMMAHMDGLTGIANRRSLDTYLPAIWAQCREQGRPLSVMVIDADHFKRYNDEHGHIAGDDLLRSLTRHLMNQLRRAEDFLARYGGEEFVVILPGADSGVAASMAESMRKSIAESPLGITVSIGICTMVPDASPPDALLARADRALYEAKRAGRNQVRVCSE